MPEEKPASLAECFTWLKTRLSQKQLDDLESLTREDLWQTHFWLSPIINGELLQDNAPLRQRFDCSAFCDDPDLAGQIATAFWDHLQITASRKS